MRYREAVTDYRTLLVLRRAIDDNPGLASSVAAAAWFDTLITGIAVGASGVGPWTDAALDRLRDDANGHMARIAAERGRANRH